MTPTHFSRFLTACKKRGITVKLTEKKYDEMRLEIVPHLVKVNVVWKREIKDLIDWLYDTGRKEINANRLRNWMKKAYRWKKEKQDQKIEKEKEEAHIRGSRTAYVASVYAQQVVNKNLV